MGERRYLANSTSALVPYECVDGLRDREGMRTLSAASYSRMHRLGWQLVPSYGPLETRKKTVRRALEVAGMIHRDPEGCTRESRRALSRVKATVPNQLVKESPGIYSVD